MRVRLIALAAVTAVAALASTFGFDTGGRSTSAQTDEAEQTGNIVVKFKPATSLGEVAQAITDAQGEAIDSTGPSGLVLVEPDPGQSVADAVAELSANGDVLFAEADVLLHASVVPNDPLYASYGWPAPMIGLPTAWNTTTGNASVIVAVIDTGVDGAHPDLSGKITTGVNAGYNFVSNTTNTADDQSHGTFVASIDSQRRCHVIRRSDGLEVQHAPGKRAETVAGQIERFGQIWREWLMLSRHGRGSQRGSISKLMSTAGAECVRAPAET